MKKLSRKERRALEKSKKAQTKKTEIPRKKSFNLVTILWWLVGIVIFAGFVMAIRSNAKRMATKPVHWHAPISYEICGESFTPPEKKEHGLVHGHNDRMAHVEGKITDKKNITLGKFMDSIGVNFSETEFATYKNGDRCPDKNEPGKVRLLVAGQESSDFRNHVLKDKESIKIVFE